MSYDVQPTREGQVLDYDKLTMKVETDGSLTSEDGGAISRMGIFALGIMPYISASIIVQLMTAMVPQLAQLKKEGQQGQKKINQYTRYGTVLLALFQAYGLAVSIEAGDLATDPGWYFRASCIITLVGGTMFLMWLGEQITARGIGNGISLIILTCRSIADCGRG